MVFQEFVWTKEKATEIKKQNDRLRDLSSLADKLGCSAAQLSIAWSLKHEPVQCLLLGATTAEQLHQSLQALQVIYKLSLIRTTRIDEFCFSFDENLVATSSIHWCDA